MKKFNITGLIVAEDVQSFIQPFDIASINIKKMKSFLEEANEDDLIVNINSSGGEVYTAIEIFNCLKKYPGSIKVNIKGLAAGIASFIAMSGDEITMSPNAILMLKRTSFATNQPKNEFEALKSLDMTIAKAYSEKSGLSEDEVFRLMEEETWLTAQKAKEIGLIDNINET